MGFKTIEYETDNQNLFIKEIVQEGAEPKFGVGASVIINGEKFMITNKKETNTTPNTVNW